ncbi:MAG TPA: cation diffusion facilitator family transporter [Feifaniaceae bacterium]|nr:cation diffusion facilitator family transporter [Feifaniaceae bacterium]
MTDLLMRLFLKTGQGEDPALKRGRYGNFASIVGVVSNLLLFLMKIFIGVASASVSIIADAVNSLSDSASSLITLFGFKLSSKPADADHPYGHARMEYISGLIVSVLILFFGLQLLQSSVQKILHPAPVRFEIITLAVLALSILIKAWQCLFYRKIGRLMNSVTLAAASVDSRNDILSSSAVLLAVVITRLTGFDLDGYMGTVVAVLILWSGVKMVKDTGSILLGTAPTKELVDSIYKRILGYESIIGLHDLSVHSYGANKCFASVHCEVPAEQDIMLSHDIIDNIERDFLKEYGIHLVIHLDPVVTNDARTDELKAKVERLVASLPFEASMHDFRVVWGISHSNLIFDVVVPFGASWSDEKLIAHIAEEIKNLDAAYHAVITVDHSYIPHVKG